MNHRVQNIFIGDGSAMSAGDQNANPTNIAAGDLAVVGRDAQTLVAGDTVADTDGIYIFQGNADGTLKRSMLIPGRMVTSFTAEPYAAATRQVWAIGHNRLTTTGSIVVANSTLYEFSILFKNDKRLYSERPNSFRVTFTSAAAATQLTIATQIAAQLNNAVIGTQVTAVVVGDGTGVYGLTGATDYGVEVTADLLTQFSTDYSEQRVRFEIFLDDTSGFGATTSAQVVAPDHGNGTYLQVYNMENFNYGYEGVLNRTKFPIPVLAFSANSTLVQTTIVPTATTTTGEDVVEFSASVSGMLAAGDFIQINNVDHQLKYLVDSNTGVLVSVATATAAGQAVEKLVAYDLINIEFSNPTLNDGPAMRNDSKQAVVIAVPAGVAGSAYTVNSAQGLDMIGILNPYMESVGFAPISI